jgi:hypothetical protein
LGPRIDDGRQSDADSENLHQDHCKFHTSGEPIMQELSIEIEVLEEKVAPSSANFPPGQFPSGNPAHAPGNSNPISIGKP